MTSPSPSLPLGGGWLLCLVGLVAADGWENDINLAKDKWPSFDYPNAGYCNQWRICAFLDFAHLSCKYAYDGDDTKMQENFYFEMTFCLLINIFLPIKQRIYQKKSQK